MTEQDAPQQTTDPQVYSLEHAYESPHPAVPSRRERPGIMLLAREELLDAPISGPPRIAPRGQIILDKAMGFV